MKKFFVLILLTVLMLGCTAPGTDQKNETKKVDVMNEITIKQGDIVQVDYVGTFENGTLFDTSIKEEAARAGLTLRDNYAPLTLTVGEHQVIKGFEDGVIGMKLGQEKIIIIKSADAYGTFNPTAMVNISRDKLDLSGDQITVGSQLQASNGAIGVVTALDNATITIDFNHPLAGKTLIFRIIIRKIN
ncbi:MAG: FKBP-type peptidyl-prolyl cis-trans isomerase [Candidatus Micrarchaeota archaeon]|nr:FKBP-type peptidyl-prolyl cis-trans isomerase [Candidatus Micrarchaeota archaeon]